MSDDRDNVTPFRRRDPDPLPPEEAALSSRVRGAPPGARELAAEQAAAQQERYVAALAKQKSDRLIAAGRIVPARITMALDLRGLEGPEVDIACGATEPDVDMWELAVPAPDQVEKLAELTGFTPAWFYQPIKPGPLLGTPIFMCGRHCEITEPDVVDENGVLLYEGEPREIPPPAQGTLF